jgi:hypothetical protein
VLYSAIGGTAMAQCESKIFFPDNPDEKPQFNECPREAETTRRTWRFGDRDKGEQMVVNSVVKLCAKCAKLWDDHELHKKAKGVGA